MCRWFCRKRMIVTEQISSGDRDGFWWVGGFPATGFNATGSYSSVGRFLILSTPAQIYNSFFAFTPAIPANATIDEANLQIKASGSSAFILVMRIFGVKNPVPSIPASYNDCVNAPLTTNTGSFTLSNWSNGVWYTSGDFAPIIQELIGQVGYQPTSNIVLQLKYVSNTAPLSILQVNASTYEGNPTDAAKLYIKYTVPALTPRIFIPNIYKLPKLATRMRQMLGYDFMNDEIYRKEVEKKEV